MADFPQFRPSSPAAPGVDVASNPTAALPFDRAAGMFADLGARMDDALDKVAASEGERAGGVAGLDPKFRPTGSPTIRGEAYDAAGLRTAMGRIETDAQAQADAIWLQNKDNPEALRAAFEDAAGKSIEGLQGSGLDQLTPHMTLSWQRIAQAKMSDAAVLAEHRRADAQRATASDQIDARLKRIEQLAYSSNPRSTEMVQAELASLQELMLSYGPRGEFAYAGKSYGADDKRAGVFELTDIQKILGDATERGAIGRIMGKFDLARGYGAKQSVRDALVKDFTGGKTPLDVATYERIINGMDADIRSARAEAHAAAAAFSAQVTTQLQLLQQGFKPTVDLGKLAIQARTSGQGGLADRIQQAQGLFDFQNAARRASPMELDAWISKERQRLDKDGADDFTGSRFKLAVKLRNSMADALKQDPLAFASDNGVRPLAPLDLRDGKTLQRRFADAEAISHDYGVPVRYFTNAERTAIAAQLEQAPPGDRIRILGALAAAAPNDRLPRMMGELSIDQPALAQAGLLLHDGLPATAAKIATGQALLKDKAAPAPDIDKALKISAPLLAALPPSMSKARGSGLQAANAIYAAEAARNGTDSFDADLYDRALNEAFGARYTSDGDRITGGFDTVRGSRVLLPSRMSAADAERALGFITDQDLKLVGAENAPPVYADGKPVKADAIADAYPVTVGPGRYAFSTTDPASAPPQFIAAKNHIGIYVLDITKLAERAKDRPAASARADAKSFEGLVPGL